jgi:TRAP-type C4-dicarboxylate transport system permease small subunit
MTRVLQKLDLCIYLVEKALLIFATATMVLLVFTDVVQRIISRPLAHYHWVVTGVPGAQTFALGLMTWVAFLGASIAARQHGHLVLGARRKNLLAGLVTSAFCFYLFSLAWLQFTNEFQDWSSGEGVGVFEAFPIPLWLVTLCLPYSFLMMALRFLGMACADYMRRKP